MGFLGAFLLSVIVLSFSELWLLVRVSAHITFAATLGLCILTGFLGGALVRRQGLRAWVRFQDELSRGRLPADELLDGLVLMVLGALLMVPGFITDALGFILLVPSLRRRVLARVKRRVARRFTVSYMRSDVQGPGGREVRDAQFEERAPEDEPR